MKDKKPFHPPVPMEDMGNRETDPQGSWTGVPSDLNEVPVQDADDL